MTDFRQLRPTSQAIMEHEGQANAGGPARVVDAESGSMRWGAAPITEYPRMLYKRTDREVTQEWADTIGELKDKPMVINRFDGYLCDTCIANSVTEAEALAELGWDISPAAAHGVVTGLAAATSAKDDEIASLRAQLAASLAQADEAETPRRGPGRPPKQQDA